MEGKLLRSGELARLAGVSTDLLRHYERIGIMPRPERTLSGYRQYPAITLDRVHAVRRSLMLGFFLAGAGAHLRDKGPRWRALPKGAKSRRGEASPS